MSVVASGMSTQFPDEVNIVHEYGVNEFCRAIENLQKLIYVYAEPAIVDHSEFHTANPAMIHYVPPNKHNKCSFESVEGECFDDAGAAGTFADSTDKDNICVNDICLYFQGIVYSMKCVHCVERNV